MECLIVAANDNTIHVPNAVRLCPSGDVNKLFNVIKVGNWIVIRAYADLWCVEARFKRSIQTESNQSINTTHNRTILASEMFISPQVL
jgi:hypothetical protein